MNYTIFGESHGNAIGVTLTGVPSGIEINMDALRSEMSRRATGKNKLCFFVVFFFLIPAPVHTCYVMVFSIPR